jgi:hypothetical protein
MSLYQNFTYKADGSSLVGDGDFIGAATGTAFEKTTGEVFTKISTNIFDKAVRKIISQTEMDIRYVNATGDGTLSGNMTPATDAVYDLGTASLRFRNIFTAYSYNTNVTVSGTIMPAANAVSDIGSSALKFNNIYVNYLNGTAQQSDKIYSTEGDANTNYYLGFMNSGSSGYLQMFHDNEIYINPYSNTIVCANFAGNASSASTIYSTEGDANGTYYLSFVASGVSGNQNMNHDNEITVNPSTNTITCTNFAGNATSSTYSDYTYVTRDDSTNGTYYINFSGIGSAQQRIRNDANLAYNPYTNVLSAGTFSGVATQARYADLAEKYESDAQYEVGTVVEIGGDKEITLYTGGALAGVISANPGLMLNSEAGDGYQYVALKGKVPVKCHKTVNKGQYCVAFDDGKVIGVDKSDLLENEKLNIVGVALSNSDNGIVMVKV